MASAQKHIIQFEADIMGVAMHPTLPLVSSALIDGTLCFHNYGGDSLESGHRVNVFPEASCRTAAFPTAHQSDVLLVGSSNGELAVVDLASGKVIQRLTGAHDNPITCERTTGGSLIACGDEGGVVKTWDLRALDKPCQSWTPHTDYVSDLTWHEPQTSLLSVSGDGTLARMDPRSKKVKNKSEDDVDDELLSVVVMKNGKKIVCGTTTGVLNIWSWGYWNDCSDRFPGHPESVEAIVKLDDDTVVTGSSDGMLRVLSIQPNKLLGVLGEHGDYPIERLALSSDGQMLASASHDQTVKLWDLTAGDEEEEEEEEEEDKEAGGGEAAATGPGDKAPAADDEEASEEEGGEEEDDSCDSSDESSEDERERKRRRGKGAHRIPSKKVQKKSSNSGFFADLA